jgi:hypothetical protein
MERKGKLHPSGRAIRRRLVKNAQPIQRIPPEEPLSPGLRVAELESAIGFHAQIAAADDDEDEY